MTACRTFDLSSTSFAWLSSPISVGGRIVAQGIAITAIALTTIYAAMMLTAVAALISYPQSVSAWCMSKTSSCVQFETDGFAKNAREVTNGAIVQEWLYESKNSPKGRFRCDLRGWRA